MPKEAPVLYSGTFERSMDAKKRVSVPASWLSGKEEEEFHVSPHPSRQYLMVMPPEEFDRVEQLIQASGLSAAEKRVAIRQFYGEAHKVAADKQGRILLPEAHCERAGLNGDVVFVGGRSRFEIWGRARYAENATPAEETYRRVAEEIGL